MGDRLFGMLIGVVVGVIPGIAMILVTAAFTDSFEDQAGLAWGVLGLLFIVLGAAAGAIVGAFKGPSIRFQSLAGVVLGSLPGLALQQVLDAREAVVLVLLIAGPLLLGGIGLRADLRNRARARAEQANRVRTPEPVA